MSVYIRDLYLYANQHDEKSFSNLLRKRFITYREQFGIQLEKLNISIHSRISESLSHLYIGLEMLFECLESYQIVSHETVENSLAEFFDILIELAKEQSNNVIQDKPSIKFVNKLNTLLQSKQAIVFDKMDYQCAGGNGFIGYEDDDYYYLIPDITHKMVKKLCEEQGESFPTSTKSLLSHLRDDGFIEVAKDSNTKQLRLGNEVKRFICLKKSKFNEIVS